jgi:hypothetical protein
MAMKVLVDTHDNLRVEEFTEFVSGKRVALVGPSAHILDMSQKDLIDGYDVVIRLNKAVPVVPGTEDSVGTRTDILMTGLDPKWCAPWKVDLWLSSGVEWVVCPYGSRHPFQRLIKKFVVFNEGRIKFRHSNTQEFKKRERALGSRPNTGFAAMWDLLNFPITELYITGISFFRTGYVPSYSKLSAKGLRHAAEGKAHKQEPQIEEFLRMLEEDSRINPDEYLQNIVKVKRGG